MTDIDEYENSTSLSWENYTSYDDIKPDGKKTILLKPIGEFHEDKFMNQSQKWFNDEGYLVNRTTYLEENSVLEIKKDNKIIAILNPFIDFIIIRKYDQEESIIDKFLNDGFMKFDLIGNVPHIERIEKVGDYCVEYRTGDFDNNEELLPRTFLRLLNNKQIIGKALVEYFEEEFGMIASTLLMFEIEENFRGMDLGTLLLKFIENKMKQDGFDTLYLADTRSMEFWKKLGYKIDIDEGYKKL